MKKKDLLKRKLVVVGLLGVLLLFTACGKTAGSDAGESKGKVTTSSESKDASVGTAESKVEDSDISELSYDELKEEYKNTLDYALFLEQEIIRLNGEVKTLSEQNDILQRKLGNE